MRTMCTLTAFALVGNISGLAIAQDYTAGYDLIVGQHPTEADPVAILEVWVWSDFACDSRTPISVFGRWSLHLSHPVVSEGRGSVDVTCRMQDFRPKGGEFQYCQFDGSPSVSGHWITDFIFAQLVDGDASHLTLYPGYPLHVMDISMRLNDLTPLDLTLSTSTRQRYDACVEDDFVSGLAEATTVIEGQTTIRVSGGSCPADFDADGELTIFDFLAYQNAFDAGDPQADFDGDGSLTIFDFLAFQNAFDAGCA